MSAYTLNGGKLTSEELLLNLSGIKYGIADDLPSSGSATRNENRNNNSGGAQQAVRNRMATNSSDRKQKLGTRR